MISFAFSDEQESFRQELLRFAEKELAPHYKKLQQRLRDVTGYLIGDGTAGIQKRIIATSMFGRVAAR
jgi:alkylation response protein AidB-like acyl-CoA dehydrogenase